jgi:tripartite-type tricarboxylate transporter receptor subunit TctC
MITHRKVVIAFGAGALTTLPFFRAIRLFAVVWATSVLVQDASAQNYPDRPIRCVVPYVAGASPDVVARIVSPKLSDRLGQTMVVDNRAGANNIIGTEIAAKSPPDGYTILLGATALAINPSLYKLSYDVAKDFAPITQMVVAHFLLVVNPSLPATTVAELIALAKARPGRLNYGTSGNGSPTHLAAELLKHLTGINVVHVPYKGPPQVLTDLIGGQIQLAFDVIATSLPHVKSGKLRALAVSGAKRSTILPEMPTIAETVPGFNVLGWQGFLAPKGTPHEIIRQLHREIVAVITLPEVRQRLEELAYEVVGSSPEQFAEFMRADTAQSAKVIAGAGIRPD